jgi:hypothetical protein
MKYLLLDNVSRLDSKKPCPEIFRHEYDNFSLAGCLGQYIILTDFEHVSLYKLVNT